MNFDICSHNLNRLLIIIGKEKFPNIKDDTEAMMAASLAYGIPFQKQVSSKGNKLPGIEETGPFFICPNCKEKGLVIYGLCKTCADAEQGKFQAKLVCKLCGHEEKSRKHIVTLFHEFGFDFKNGTKKELGIKTITDDGVK